MLDIKLIRQNADMVKAALNRRGGASESASTHTGGFSGAIDEILQNDKVWREGLQEVETLKAEQNRVSKKIPQMKKAGEDTTAVFAEMKQISEKIKLLNESVAELEGKIKSALLNIPNLPLPEVPDGLDEESNVEIRKWGKVPTFSFEPKGHWEIGAQNGELDPVLAAKVTGSRFHFLKGKVAKLERNLVSFFIDSHVSNGYTEIAPPFVVNAESMTGTGQLPKFADDAFKLENHDYYLNPTAEVALTNMFRGDILSLEDLPAKFTAYSPSFRAEAGSAGRDTRGLIRQHQFSKVEIVKFCKPEESQAELESLLENAESLLQKLNLPYRVVKLCGGDLGFSNAMTYDIEVWMPSYGRYVEISSCSSYTDYQARRMNIRYRDGDGKINFVHTLNGSGVAVGRCVAAIMENYQTEDGNFDLPEVLS